MGKEAFTFVLAVQQATECHNPAAPQLDAFYMELVKHFSEFNRQIAMNALAVMPCATGLSPRQSLSLPPDTTGQSRMITLYTNNIEIPWTVLIIICSHHYL